MLLLFAPASAIVPCPSASPLACRCCCRRHRRHSATKRAFAFAPFSVRDCSRWCHLLLLRHSPFGIAVANAAVAAVAIPPLCKLLPLRRSPFRIASINTAAAVNVPLPRELLLWRHSQFGIAVTPSRHHASICFCALLWSGSQRWWQCHCLSDIFLLQDLNCAAGRRCRQPIIGATKPPLPPSPPILSLSLSCLLQPFFFVISGPPLLPPFLVCGRHPCHLS